MLFDKVTAGAWIVFHPCTCREPHGRVYRPCRVWQNLRATRVNLAFCTNTHHPCRKRGFICPVQNDRFRLLAPVPSSFRYGFLAVSYTHLTLPTNREV